MRNRFIALLCAFLFALSTSLPVFADSALSCPHCGGNLTVKAQKLNIGAGADASTYKCDSCGRWAYANGVGGLDLIAVGSQAILDSAERSGLLSITYSEVPSSTLTTPPEGYTGEGVANYNASGILQLVVEPYGIQGSSSSNAIVGSSGSGTAYFKDQYVDAFYRFTAPCDGIYFLGSLGSPYYLGTFSIFYNSSWRDYTFERSYSSYYGYSLTLNAGDSSSFSFRISDSDFPLSPFRYSLVPLVVFCEPLGGSSVTNKTYITINDNSFNGNIYVDNSSNLTYIYPQYTTITEEGDTVTNISETVIVYNNTTNQYITYDQTTNNYYYITTDGNPPVVPTPTPEPTATPTPSTDPYEPIGVGDSQSFETNGETSLSGSVSAKAGDYILATVSARSDITIPDSMTTLKIGDYVTASSGTKQAMSFAYEQVKEDGTYTYTFTQSSTGRMYLNLIVLSNIDGLKYSGKYHSVGTGSSSLPVPNKSYGDMLVWGCSSIAWSTSVPCGLWTTSPDDLIYVGLSTSTQARQANFIDTGMGSISRTFSADESVEYVIDAVEIIPITVEPSPTPTPDPGSDLEPTPTPAPGGGYDDTNLLDKLGLWFADVNLNMNLAIENLALNFNTAIENLSADFDVYIKDLSANFTAVIEELQLNFKLAIENLNLTIQNYFGGGSGGSGSDISTPETAEPSPTPEPTPPPLEEEEPVDSFLVQWLRAVVEHIQELLEPVQAVGSVYSDFYSYLPLPWQSALLGVFALLLVFALWRIFHG